MKLGYNTNGLTGMSVLEAIDLLASIGYQSVAITLDNAMLYPFGPDLPKRLSEVRDALDRRQMNSTIETGARFLLDPNVKHEPTLVTADRRGRARRVDFLRRAIDVAADLGSDCVSLWSGAVRDPSASEEDVWERLVGGLREVLAHAQERNVAIGFEPEPDMFVDTMSKYDAMRRRLEAQGVDLEPVWLTLDVGHLHCQGEVPIAGEIRRWAGHLANVHIEDMRTGVHEHLMFGEGEIEFPPVLAAFAEVGYVGPVHVELSRHGAIGPEAARQAFDLLAPMILNKEFHSTDKQI